MAGGKFTSIVHLEPCSLLMAMNRYVDQDRRSLFGGAVESDTSRPHQVLMKVLGGGGGGGFGKASWSDTLGREQLKVVVG